jgi:hypothetical protein
MPKELHNRLSRAASKKGLKGERKDAYVYGTMSKIEGKKKKPKTARKPKIKSPGTVSSRIRVGEVKKQIAANKQKRQQKNNTKKRTK